MKPQILEDQSFQSDPSGEDMPILENTPIRVKRTGIIARLLHGTGAGAVAYGLGIVSNLLLLPLYLRFWSVAVYGEWMALYSVVMYLGNLDFGVTTAAITAARMAHASKDWETFKRVQGTAWAAALAIAGLGGVVVAILSLFYFHIDRWLGLKVMGHRDARLVFSCLAIALLANIPGRQLIAVYTATGSFAKCQWLYNAYSLLSCITTAVALAAGAGPVSLAVVISATSLSTIVFSMWLLRRGDARLYPRLQDSSLRTAHTLASPTGQYGIWMLASMLTLQGPVIVLSRMLGGPAVALFTTTRTVANVVRGTLVLLRAPLAPELSAVAVLPSKDALRRLFRFTVGIDVAIAISLTAVLWSAGTWLIRFWSHGRISPDPLLLHLLLLASVIEGFLQILAIAGFATNRIKAMSVGQLISAVLSLVLAVALVGRFGLSAIPLGVIVPLILIMTPVALRNACSYAHLPARFVAGRLLLPFAIITAFTFAFPTWLAQMSFGSEWISTILSPLVICMVAVFTSGVFFLNHDDRKALRGHLLGKFASEALHTPALGEPLAPFNE
jgi:O-antigen/teichoic acid export membrane protein